MSEDKEEERKNEKRNPGSLFCQKETKTNERINEQNKLRALMSI